MKRTLARIAAVAAIASAVFVAAADATYPGRNGSIVFTRRR